MSTLVVTNAQIGQDGTATNNNFFSSPGNGTLVLYAGNSGTFTTPIFTVTNSTQAISFPGSLTVTGTITATGGFSGTLTGAASTVTIAAVTNNASYFPTFVTAQTGGLAVDTSVGLTFNPSTNVLTLGGVVTVAGTASVAPIVLTSGTNLTTAAAGSIEYDGVNLYGTVITTEGRAAIPVRQHFRLTVNGSNVTTIANFFGTTSNITLVASAYYEIEIVCWFTKTTTETLTWTFTNSAAPTSMNIHVEQSALTGVVGSGAAAAYLAADIINSSTAAQTYSQGSLTTAVNHFIKFRITLKNGTGTSLLIQCANPAGSVTPLLGSYWTAVRLATGNVGTFHA